MKMFTNFSNVDLRKKILSIFCGCYISDVKKYETKWTIIWKKNIYHNMTDCLNHDNYISDINVLKFFRR